MICLSTNPLCSLRTVSFLVQLLWSVTRKIRFDIKRHLVAQCRRKRRPERERSNWNTFQTAPTQNEKIFLPAPYANVGHRRWIERNWVIFRLFKLRALMKFVRTRRGTFRVSRLGHTFDRRFRRIIGRWNELLWRHFVQRMQLIIDFRNSFSPFNL
jgi:hypothetical protein